MANPHTALNGARRACVAVCAVGAWVVADAADWLEPRTARDRPGVHRAGFDLRVTDEQGRPAQATVSVCRMGQECSRTNGRLATATTDDSGYAGFRNVSSPHSLYFAVEPPERLRPRYLPIERVSSGIADLGILRLKRKVVITGTVKRSTDGGEPTALFRGSVSIYAIDDGAMLQWANVRGGRFRLENFDIEPMEIEFDDRVSTTRDHRAPVPIDSERDRLHLELIADREAGGDGELRVVASRDVPPEPGPVPDEEPTHRIDLRFVDTEGEPITGARVSVAGAPKSGFAFTDADGRFVLDAFKTPEWLYLWGPSGTVAVGVESPSDLWLRGPPDVVADIIRQNEIEIPVLRRVELEVSGIDAEDLAYRWRRFARSWAAVDQTLVERVVHDYPYPVLLRVDAPGRLPRFAAYPPQGALALDFAADREHTLVVVDSEGPIVGATVDLIEVASPYLDHVAANDPEADIVLASLSADAEGRLALLGNPNALYLAYAYAEGYEPARVLLHAGSETRVELVKRDATVAFTGLSIGELLRVKVAGGESLVLLRRVVDTSAVVASLAPGSYDVSVENADGSVDRGTTFVVDKGALVVDTTVDRRPGLIVRLPELPVVPERYRTDAETAAATPPVDRWIAWASRRTPAGRPVGAAAITTFGGVPATESPVEGEIREGPGEMSTAVLHCSGSGRWLVYLAAERRSLRHVYFVEVELVAGEKRDLPLPPLDASLEGSMAYETDLGFNIHGVAGPRMVLTRAAGADAGWNVVNFLPERLAQEGADRDRFVLHDLPGGDYHLFHHLGGDSVWAGIEVSLRSGRTTKMRRLGSDEPGPWTVDVVDSRGRPILDQVLRVRDRMHEAWEAYAEIPTTGRYAADAIPLPPAARLHGEPVSFESIRPGWVELVLDDPAGPARHYLRKAEPGSTLTLVVED